MSRGPSDGTHIVLAEGDRMESIKNVGSCWLIREALHSLLAPHDDVQIIGEAGDGTRLLKWRHSVNLRSSWHRGGGPGQIMERHDHYRAVYGPGYVRHGCVSEGRGISGDLERSL
jgi:hypothetical protein